MRPSLLAVAVTFAFLFLSHGRSDGRRDDAPPSVVLFIGDGMGTSQVTLGRLAAGRLGRPYALDRFRTIGLAATSASDNVVTESSASATALACGVKTRNRAIGIDDEGRPRRTLLEVARAAGLATGVVTNTRLTDSTPAAFMAHVADRREEDAIARQLVERGAPDLLLGGGGKYFDGARRAALRARGYVEVSGAGGLARVTAPRVLGLFAEDDLAHEVERDASAQPSLAELTERALALLGAAGRFALVVEGGRIDHAAHHHDAPQVAREQIAFAEAVGVALDRVAHGAKLLVVVTGDHATGSLGITERIDLDGLLAVKRSAESIHADPACRDDAGLVRAVRAASGLELDTTEVAEVRRPPRPPAKVVALGHVISRRLGVTFYEVDEQESQTVTRGHDGAMVPVYAAGPGAEAFAGTYENTLIPLLIAKALAIPRPGAKLF